jgi:hypothetical protein
MKEWLLLLLLVITVIISPTAVTWRPNRGQLQLWTVSSSACTTANLQRGCYCYSSLEPENAHCFEEATVPDNHHRTLNRDRAAWCIQNPWLRWQRHWIVALHCIFQNPNVASFRCWIGGGKVCTVPPPNTVAFLYFCGNNCLNLD